MPSLTEITALVTGTPYRTVREAGVAVRGVIQSTGRALKNIIKLFNGDSREKTLTKHRVDLAKIESERDQALARIKQELDTRLATIADETERMQIERLRQQALQITKAQARVAILQILPKLIETAGRYGMEVTITEGDFSLHCAPSRRGALPGELITEGRLGEALTLDQALAIEDMPGERAAGGAGAAAANPIPALPPLIRQALVLFCLYWDSSLPKPDAVYAATIHSDWQMDERWKLQNSANVFYLSCVLPLGEYSFRYISARNDIEDQRLPADGNMPLSITGDAPCAVMSYRSTRVSEVGFRHDADEWRHQISLSKKGPDSHPFYSSTVPLSFDKFKFIKDGTWHPDGGHHTNLSSAAMSPVSP